MSNITDATKLTKPTRHRRRSVRWAARAAAVSLALATFGAIGAGTAHAGAYGPNCGVFTVDDGSQVWMPWQCAANATIQDAEAEAVDKVGYNYVWAGESPAEGGFDCSGLVHWAYNHAGVGIPRLSAQGYYNNYTKVAYANKRPGDLIFYRNSVGSVVHVEIYLGRNGDNGVEETVAARTPRVGIFRPVSSMSDGNGGTLTRMAYVSRIVL